MSSKFISHALGALAFFNLGLAVTAAAIAEDRRDAERPTEVTQLFDGRSLDAFYTWLKATEYEDPDRVFRVTDDLLHVTGNGWGGLVTKKMYRDYHCVLEFKWGERTWTERADKARDSGLLVHSQGQDGGYGGIWMPSLEVQIIEGGVGDFILVPGPDKDGRPVPLSLTAEVTRDRDGEVVWQAGGTEETFDLANRGSSLSRACWCPGSRQLTEKRHFRSPVIGAESGHANRRLRHAS